MYLGFGEFIYLLFIINDGEKPRRLKKTINPSKVPTLAARGLEEHWGGYVSTIHFEMKLDVFRFW